MASKKRQRASGEGSSHPTYTRFPTSTLLHRYNSNLFQTIPFKVVDRRFFLAHCIEIFHIIEYYRLGLLVMCDHAVNVPLLEEFYNNLIATGSDHQYHTVVGGKSLEFSPRIWEQFLGCLPSQSDLVIYPSYTDPLPSPFEAITLDSLHQEFFHGPRLPNVTRFDSQQLQVMDNVLYKVVIHCILPIVTRGMAKIRAPHAFMMHALKHRLDVNIALNSFMCIIHHIEPIRGKIHMPFGHILTAWIECQGVHIPEEGSQPVTHYDFLSERNLSLAGLKVQGGQLQWNARRRQPEAVRGAEDAADSSEESADEYTIKDRLIEMQELMYDGYRDLAMAQEEQTAQIASRLDSLTLGMQTMQQQQSEIMRLLQARDPRPTTSVGVQVPAYDYMDLGDDDD